MVQRQCFSSDSLIQGMGKDMMQLKARNIKKSFVQGEVTVHVLQSMNATFDQGKTYAITGPSGSGKSTVMHLLAGLDKPDHGHVFFNEKDVASFSPTERQQFLNKSVGLVFQLPYLIRELSVLENVMLKGMIQGLDAEHNKKLGHELLHKVGLATKADHNPFVLSGGEQQRVALARALFNKPAFLLADEPTGNLDLPTGKKIVDLMLACQAEWGMGVIVTSHDAYVAERMGTVLHLENGTL